MTDMKTMAELYNALVQRLADDMASEITTCVRALAQEYTWSEEQQETLARCMTKLNVLTFLRTTELFEEFQRELQRNKRIGFMK